MILEEWQQKILKKWQQKARENCNNFKAILDWFNKNYIEDSLGVALKNQRDL